MYETCTQWLQEIGFGNLDVLEVSAGNYWRTLPFRSFREANFPEFDICENVLDQKFDLIIADQVFEHLLWPRRAAQNVRAMLKPGGRFLMTTPFLIRVHAIPTDCTRWTEMGMQYFLADAGFPLERIRTGSWGNRQCVKANFSKWARRGWFGSLKNEPDFPVAVWALAQTAED
jgi:SAM-dependent methyltransferase